MVITVSFGMVPATLPGARTPVLRGSTCGQPAAVKRPRLLAVGRHNGGPSIDTGRKSLIGAVAKVPAASVSEPVAGLRFAVTTAWGNCGRSFPGGRVRWSV